MSHVLTCDLQRPVAIQLPRSPRLCGVPKRIAPCSPRLRGERSLAAQRRRIRDSVASLLRGPARAFGARRNQRANRTVRVELHAGVLGVVAEVDDRASQSRVIARKRGPESATNGFVRGGGCCRRASPGRAEPPAASAPHRRARPGEATQRAAGARRPASPRCGRSLDGQPRRRAAGPAGCSCRSRRRRNMSMPVSSALSRSSTNGPHSRTIAFELAATQLSHRVGRHRRHAPQRRQRGVAAPVGRPHAEHFPDIRAEGVARAACGQRPVERTASSGIMRVVDCYRSLPISSYRNADGDDAAVEVPQVELLVRRVRVLVGQADAEEHRRHAELLLERRDDRNRSAFAVEHRRSCRSPARWRGRPPARTDCRTRPSRACRRACASASRSTVFGATFFRYASKSSAILSGA